MTTESVSPSAPSPVDPTGPQRKRLSGLRRALAPVAEARGLPRWVLFIGLALVLVFVVFAIFAPWISPYNFDQYVNSHGQRFPKSGAPSSAHWLGTNIRSTDVFSHIVYGSRTALEVIAIAVVISMLLGVPLGLFSGYYGGPLDRGLVLVMDAMFAFPSLLLAILIAFLLRGKFDFLGSSFSGVMSAAISITVIYVPQYFRVIRNSVISVREEPYVEAARVLGAKPRTVIGRYVLGNVVQNVPVIATLNAADALLTLAGSGLPRVRRTADGGGGVGLRPPARTRGGQRRHLVDLGLSRSRDRPAGDRPDAGRREPQRPAQPGAASPSAAAGRDPGHRCRRGVDRGGRWPGERPA